MTAVIEVAARNLHGIDELRRRLTPVREPYQRARALLARNTPLRARKDIAAHYDLGNDLFELMLDETMMYSCAIFERRDMSLAEASRAKLDRICDKLDLQPSDHVLEIGTGWGGFAAARRGHARLPRDDDDALARAARAGARARARGRASRTASPSCSTTTASSTGTYDKLVSIEMIEAVGWQDFGTFFAHCAALLRPDGVMALQAITIDDRLYEVEKAQRSFMNSLIFPNGCLPSVEVIARNVARRSDLRMVDLEDITPHYAETLRRWRANVEAHAPRLGELGLRRALPAAVAALPVASARRASPSAGSATSRSCSPSRAGAATWPPPKPPRTPPSSRRPPRDRPHADRAAGRRSCCCTRSGPTATCGTRCSSAWRASAR